MRVKFIDLTPHPFLRRELDDAYDRVMSSGSYLRGMEVERFEREWADYIGIKHCIAVQSGSEALRLLDNYFSPSMGRVIPWNSTPTIDALYRTTFDLVPTGPDLNLLPSGTHCFDRLFILVHLYGNPARADEFGKYMIEDACQAHGATYNGKKCGSFGLAAAWSFYPTKNLGAFGDAGAITTNNDDLAEVLRGMRCTRIDALQAAFLSVKLPYLDGWNARRRDIAEQYRDGLHNVGYPAINPGARPNYHLFVIMVQNRARLAQDLKDRGVETMVHYQADNRVLSLPCNPNMNDAEVQYVIEQVNECMH